MHAVCHANRNPQIRIKNDKNNTKIAKITKNRNIVQNPNITH